MNWIQRSTQKNAGGGERRAELRRSARRQQFIIKGTKESKAHDTVLVFYEHPLKILNARTIKFSYNEGQLVSVPKGDCIDLDLGIGSGKIPDNSITASSGVSEAKNGRLNEIKAWCASTEDAKPYLQIELETIHIVCAVSTQGNPNADQWIETYTIQVSTDGTTWTDYKEHGQNKTFTGSNDRNAENKNILYEGVLAKTLRFIGQSSHIRFCLRTEIYEVKLKPENLAAGKPTRQSSTYRDADSEKAVDGNLGTGFSPDNRQCAHTNKDNPSWWWVDLGSDNVPVSEVLLVNRFSPLAQVQERNKDLVLTLGQNDDVVNNSACNGRYTFIQFIASAVCHRNPLTTGRYFGIKTTKRQFLTLCEVEVYSRENLAYQKDTNQSSIGFHAASSKAVDGCSNTNWNGGSCAHTRHEKQPWWRVDLGKVELVNEVYVVNRGDCCGDRLNPFEIRVGVNSSNGGITNPKCGDGYSVPQGQGASFFCRPSLYGRYVTIRRHDERTEPLNFCEVEVYSTRRACQIQAIGLASSDAFADNSFSASTHRSGNEASKGRLNGNGAWSPSRNNDVNDYLQIDLKDQFFVCAIATQGSSSHDHWTTKYKFLYSLDNSTWLTYQENDIDKVFNANDGRRDIVKHSLVGIVRARFIRFRPTEFSTGKALRVEVYGILTTTAPSRAPTSFTVTPSSSTSVRASWQLPTADFQMITGFRLLYRNSSSVEDPLTVITIESNSILSHEVTGLGIFTKYEFQVLTFSLMGDGPPSSVKTVRTDVGAPSQAPTNLGLTVNNSTSISVNWQLPPGISQNGPITGFTVYYQKTGASGKANTVTVDGETVLSKTITGMEKYTEYDIQVSAFTYAGDGPKSSVVTERTSEDAPSFGPDNLVTTELNETTFNISWAPLPTEKSNGILILYEAKAELVLTRPRSRRAVASSKGLNTTKTFAVLKDFLTCSQYRISVRAFTVVGPGPYGPPTQLHTSRPAAPRVLVAMIEETKVRLEWTPPTNVPEGGVKYKVKYTGTKDYNTSFLDIGEQDAQEATNYLLENLVPGTLYKFKVSGESVCVEGQPTAVDVTTKISAPLAPYVGEITDIRASKSSAVILLWPAEQRNGPIRNT
ncbi:uncharacterized protein [Porites lutea]|uniref:uncharacterized protein n=1 Tax=Porites lutea TaxID=51062 RepID=UPI003CC6C62C